MTDTPPIPESELLELLSLSEKATPIPWQLWRCAPESDEQERLIIVSEDREDEISQPFLRDEDGEYCLSAANRAPALIRELLARRKAMEEAPHAPSCESLNRFIHEQPCRFWTTGICLTEKDINGNIIDRSATCHAAPCSCWKSKWSTNTCKREGE